LASSTVIPDRIAWAIELMAVGPHDQLLEIGPGSGVAIAAITERLRDGTITGIDRSEKAIEAARRRNAAAIASGRVTLQAVALEDAVFPDATFDKVLVINVNLFWVKDAALEVALIRRVLKPGGKVYLFYEPPSKERLAELTRAVASVLKDAGFTVSTRTASGAKPLACVIGQAV
jgi:ubiquinone/menaquinone biosynthesis C-methylase UbiE